MPTHTYQPKQEIAGLWIGDTLPLIAELSIRSYLANGIAFRLFTYKDYENIPQGTTVHDAREIIPEAQIFRHDNGSLAPFADWFRNVWLERAGGFWTDLDIACLTPGLPRQLPWFAQQDPGLIAVGVIGFPPHHPLIQTFRKLSEDPATPMPWDDDNELAAKRQFKQDTPNADLRRRRAAWGNAGPEGFTRALAHFNLLHLAAPSSTIYPLHYTVWRNCYNGLVSLSSPEMQGAWAIHLWGEMLRNEPDALENVNKNSIVGQLLDHYIPHTHTPAAKKKKVKIIVGACSCVSAEKRRHAIRRTWMKNKQPDIETLFFVGRRDTLPDEKDTLCLWADDRYDYLPQKVLAFFQHALQNYHFEWLFKCDDDTYIALDRLAGLADEKYDLIGDLSLAERNAPSGGAGYMLSRPLVEKIVAAAADIPATGAEDLIFGELAIRLGAKTHADKRLNMYPTPYPMPDNDLITAHWCPPEQLNAIANFQTAAPVAVYQGSHSYWNDILFFYSDGTFRRKQTGCSGKYTLKNRQSLTLEWFAWPAENLVRQGDTYQGSNLTLTLPAGQPDITSLLLREKKATGDNSPLLIQLGCGDSRLPGWLNVDLPNYDITSPLPWENETINALYLEHVLEFVECADIYEFLLEAWRTLKPGGAMRLVITDTLRLIRGASPEHERFLRENCGGSPAGAAHYLMQKNGRRGIWTAETLCALLEAVGFETSICPWGKSPSPHMCSLEGHSPKTNIPFEQATTTCIEALKPHHIA